MIPYQIIATGSTGNAVIISPDFHGEPVKILIDCGVPFASLQYDYKELQIVFLTHEHGDHFNRSTLRRLTFERPRIRIASPPWLVGKLIDSGIPARQIDTIKPGTVVDYGICKAIPFEVRHDALNCGWKLLTGSGKLIYVTDTTDLTGITAKSYDLYMIEANYDEADIQQRIADKTVNGEYIYEKRVLETHMSQQDAESWLYANMGGNSQYVFLHQHNERRI